MSFKPAKAKGFEVDFGKFVTSAGAEVIESYSNWNYSRSLALFLGHSVFSLRLADVLADGQAPDSRRPSGERLEQ